MLISLIVNSPLLTRSSVLYISITALSFCPFFLFVISDSSTAESCGSLEVLQNSSNTITCTSDAITFKFLSINYPKTLEFFLTGSPFFSGFSKNIATSMRVIKKKAISIPFFSSVWFLSPSNSSNSSLAFSYGTKYF